MNSFETQFARRMAAMIDDFVKEKIGQLATGAAGSFDEYRYRIGYLKALDDCVAMLDRVESDMREPERKQVPPRGGA